MDGGNKGTQERGSHCKRLVPVKNLLQICQRPGIRVSRRGLGSPLGMPETESRAFFSSIASSFSWPCTEVNSASVKH